MQDAVGESSDNPYKNTVTRGRNGLDFDNGTYYAFRLSGTFNVTILIFAMLLPGMLAGTFSGWWRGKRVIVSRYEGLLK